MGAEPRGHLHRLRDRGWRQAARGGAVLERTTRLVASSIQLLSSGVSGPTSMRTASVAISDSG